MRDEVGDDRETAAAVLDPVHPSREDPVVAAASALVGGPIGDHARRHPAWTVLRVALVIAAFTFGLGMFTKFPCAMGGAWFHGSREYAFGCSSGLQQSYFMQGLTELTPPLSSDGGRFDPQSVSAPTAALGYVAALGTHALEGWPDVDVRNNHPVDQQSSDETLQRESVMFVAVCAFLLMMALLAAVACLVGTHRSRPWDALGLAASPLLLFNGITGSDGLASVVSGWDLVAVAFTAGGMWAWSRQRELLAGALIGAGVAVGFWPIVVLLAWALLGGRARRMGQVGLAAGMVLVVWMVIDFPAYVGAGSGWLNWFTDKLSAGAGAGSIWALLGDAGLGPDPTTVNRASLGGWLLVLVAVGALTWTAHRRPRVPQVALLLLLGGLILARSYEPWYALWLLPLAALARPSWRDLLIWQAAELFYGLTLWWQLDGYTVHAGATDWVTVIGILVRLAGEIYLAVLVIRDVTAPWHDPVRRDGLTDDPAGGVLDQADEVGGRRFT
ncbi:MAG: hypothetical protein ACRDP1_02895 [Nocardioidaceae bacterium]